MDDMTKLASIPLTGTQFRISAGDYSATVTELGAGLREFRYRDRPVIAEYGPDELPPGASGQLLAPWPNRIDGGRYAFEDASYQLDLSEPARGNAIHGLTRWAGWRPAAQAADAVQLRHVLYGRPGYPFCLDLTAEYRVSASEGLQVSVTASNAGSRVAPYGTGAHPYLAAGTRWSTTASSSCPPPGGCRPTSAASRRASRRTSPARPTTSGRRARWPTPRSITRSPGWPPARTAGPGPG